VEIAIVGSGFSGIAMAVGLLRRGFDDIVVLERADEVGGTWRDNAYPGCACDVPSHLYSFSFAPNPEWSATFSPQAEIRDYLRRVADDFGVTSKTRFACELLEASWDPARQRWDLDTSRGTLSARVLIAAPGPLAEPRLPRIPGIDRFQGAIFHSARWDHDHDLGGERVAVVGTGASAIQFVPEIQPRVGRLHLFQRTAPWVMPRRSRPITALERAIYRRFPRAQRAMRAGIYWGRELYALPMLRARLARRVRRLAKAHLRRRIDDPELRRKLTPDYLPGCKRILISNNYYPSLAKPNVEVLSEGLAEIRERSVVGSNGSERPVDTIIFGTGFHVLDLPFAERVRSAAGVPMSEAFDGSPRAYRGTTIAGYPNFFFMLGPNTGLGHTSVVFMAEAQAHYIAEALHRMRVEGIGAIEVREEAQDRWNERIQAAMPGSVWTEGGCKSWYIDERGFNTSIWPDFTFRFRARLREFDLESYVAEPLRAGPDAPPTSVSRHVAAGV
jgi:cation diffusion facilitator CzcD-associated flavoprotein CzcO